MNYFKSMLLLLLSLPPIGIWAQEVDSFSSSTNSISKQSEDINPSDHAELDPYAILEDSWEALDWKSFNSDKDLFKRRKAPYKDYKLVINIETNFSVPLIGVGKYFGRIYLTPSTTEVNYRDELIANRHYKAESKKPADFYTARYLVSEIIDPSGLTLIKQAGAEVAIQSQNFSNSKGGRLKLKVKAPNQNAILLVIDVEILGNLITNYVVVDGTRYPFDSFKINAKKSLVLGTSILNGIGDVEFTHDGSTTYTIRP